VTSSDAVKEAVMVSQAEFSKRNKSRSAGLVLACIVLVSMGLFNLPCDYVETEATWFGAREIISSDSQFQFQVLPTMAGWPLRYSVQYEDHGRGEYRYWSTPKLVANLCIALCMAIVVYAYVQIRHWKINAASNRRLTQSIFDIGTALAILIVPTVVVAWHYNVANQHRRLASQLLRYGNCQMSCWLPQPIVEHIPSGLVSSLMRLRQVQIIAPDQQIVERVTRVPTLVAFHSFGGTFDSSAIEPLSENIHFSALALNRRSLSEADLALVAQLRWLVKLNLIQSNLNSEMLRQLDDMQRLKWVNLSYTELGLSQLGVPKWSATVEDLYLSRPATGSEGSLHIDGWPRLRRLSVSRLSAELNESILQVQLSNLPSLEFLRIDRNQKHHLVLHNLPRLARIEEDLSSLQRLLDYNDLIPGLTWASELHLDGVASLPQIGCFARDLESLSVRDAIGLKSVKLGSYLISAMGSPRPQPADPLRCQAWIQKLGDRDGPGTLDLSGLPLSQADLSPLANNSRIRRLGLRNSGVSFDQVKQLAAMKQIESLDIGSCRLEADQLTWILEEFPELENLTIDGAGLTRFDLTANRRLKIIKTSMLENPTDIRIVDHPSIQTFLTMARAPEQMEIRNAYSLRGLALRGPWPKHAKVSGLRDLEWFAGGGKAIDDELLDVLLQCGSLDQLTLAYTSISREKATEIGQLDDLSMLAIPGADIDDEVTANWHKLKSLWELNLDDTSVSVETIAWLSRLQSLRRLSLNRVPLSNDAADALAEVRQICELQLAGVSIETEKLKRLLNGSNIESLDLSGRTVDAEFVDTIAGAASLKHLVLHDSQIDAKSLNQILDSNPSIYIDLGKIPGFADDEMLADLRQRARVVRFKFNTGWKQVFLATDAVHTQHPAQTVEREYHQAQMISLVERPRAGTINPQAFRPPQVRDSTE
jgi:Leucine-rich repeat (LRR) protein